MRAFFSLAAVLPLLLVLLVGGVGSAQAASNAGDVPPDAQVDHGSSLIELGAFTVPVQQPHHVTYFVTRVVVGFSDAQAAQYYAEADRLVRLRHIVFEAVFDIRPDAVTGELRIDMLQTRIERQLSTRLRDLTVVQLQMLGVHDVPRH
jgi:hypothetical protein